MDVTRESKFKTQIYKPNITYKILYNLNFYIYFRFRTITSEYPKRYRQSYFYIN